MTETAKDEITRQTVVLVFSLLGVVGMAYLAKLMEQPDTMREMRMRAAWTAKEVCDKTALKLLNLSDKAIAMYEKERV